MRTFMRGSAVSAALLVAVATMVSAQSHPSFAGTWVLDPAKTQIEGQAAAPSSATRVVVMHGDTLVVDNEAATDAGTQKTHLVWMADGKTWKNSIDMQGSPVDVASILTWDGSTLVITSTIEVMGTSVTQIDHWMLGADGKTMVAKRSLSAEGQDIGTTTMTYVKKS